MKTINIKYESNPRRFLPTYQPRNIQILTIDIVRESKTICKNDIKLIDVTDIPF